MLRNRSPALGEWRDYDERLTLFLLNNRRRARFGKWVRHLPDEQPSQGEEDVELDGHLDEIELQAEFLETMQRDGETSSRVEE